MLRRCVRSLHGPSATSVAWALLPPAIALALLAALFIFLRGEDEPTVLLRIDGVDSGLRDKSSAVNASGLRAGFKVWEPGWIIPGLAWQYVDSTRGSSAALPRTELAFVNSEEARDRLTIEQSPGFTLSVQKLIPIPTERSGLALWQIPGPNTDIHGGVLSQYVAHAGGFQFVFSFFGPNQPQPEQVARMLRSMRP